jgi:pimeloyl-ACP methyl ester carboxylesterase
MGRRFARMIALLAMAAALHAAAAAAQEPKGFYIETPTAKLWTLDTGGGGTTVVLLHSNTGTVARWDKQIPALVHAGFRVVAFDREGSGKSVTKPGSRPTSVTEDLETVVDHLRLSSFDLVGEAGGGYVALDYAAWRPQRVRALVVAASGAGLSDAESKKFRTGAAIPGFDGMPPAVRELSPSYRGDNPDGVAQWLAIEKTAAQGAASNPILRTPNTLAKLEQIGAPMLVIAADVDLQTPPGAVRLWAKHMKNYEFALISEAGHSVSWEQPQNFNALVVDFLKRHER